VGKAKYLIKSIANMHYKQYFETINLLHKETGMSRPAIFFDTIKCALKYQAGYVDYRSASMYDLTDEQRADVITRGVNNQYIAKYNDFDYIHYFHNKQEFNTLFADYLKRDWLLITSADQRDEFIKFAENKDQFMLKPTDGEGGEGVQKLPAEVESFDANIDKVPFLVEEVIEQDETMASLNPTSVNTIRVLTFIQSDGTSEIVGTYLRIGRGGIVDNFCSGGMVTPVDKETGVVHYPAVNSDIQDFATHPLTNTPIVGFKVPYFDELKKMTKEAALKVPQVRFVGWDVGISKKGPCLIEGNEYPAYFYNFKVHHPDGKGSKHVFDAIIHD
jgi:hypothetical protein